MNKILYTWNVSFGPFCTTFLCCRFDSNWIKLLHQTKSINNECNFVSPSIQTHTVTYPTHPIRYSNIQTVSNNKSQFRILNDKWKKSTFSLLNRKTMQHLRYICSTNKNTMKAIFLQLTHCILFISSKGNLGGWRGFEKCGSEWPRTRNRWQAQYSSFDLFNLSMDNLTSGIDERVTWKLSFSFPLFSFFF